MSVRALIIAVEHYPETTEFAPQLPGTLDAAAEFATWLCGAGGASPGDVHVCASGDAAFPAGVHMHGATRPDVLEAFEATLARGKDATERLFVYLAGHGVQLEHRGWEPPDDILLLADFVASDRSGTALIFIEELQRRLAMGLGPGVQFCFVDACRTTASDNFFPQQLGVAAISSAAGAACVHRLSSTRPGATAATKSRFTDALVGSLRGNARLEVDEDGTHWVTLDAAAEAVSRAMGGTAESVGVRMDCTNDRMVSIAEPPDVLEAMPPGPVMDKVKRLSGPVPTIGRGADGSKGPPVELLRRYDRIIFLGETNGQLPQEIREAAELRENKWRRIDVFSLRDYAEHGRLGKTAAELEDERNRAESELYPLLARHCEDFAIYRYDYIGTYGSLWEHDETGMRRVHMSARVEGLDIRSAPSVDFLEVAGQPSAEVQSLFDKAEELIRTTRPLAGPSVIVSGAGIKESLESLNPDKGSGLSASQAAALAKVSAILADEAPDPDVMAVPEHELAALLQTYLEERAEEGVDLGGQPLAGAKEVKFDDHDVLGWAGSFFTWVAKLNKSDWIEPAPIADEMPNGARIAILGDWGSGLYAAPVIGDTLEHAEEHYDVLVHLGDVYYSGTKRAVRKRFLAHWPQRDDAVSRACNANHEMYAGGHGYFEEILPRFEQAASPFAMQNDHWLLVGLDSAYDNHDLHVGQTQWLQALIDMAGDRKVVLLSHHQPISIKEKQGPKLVEKLKGLLESGRIFAWYWGHEHRCVLHDKHPQWSMWGRCIGHSGYPYFREDLHGQVVHEVGEDRWVRQDGPAGVPPGIILDGPNPYVDDKPEQYGPQGYATIELHPDHLVERIHGPEGAVLFEQELN